MEKYLFTDGTNEVREVQSNEELQSLIRATGDTAKIRIWLYNTSEWVTYADFNMTYGKRIAEERKDIANVKDIEKKSPVPQKKKKNRSAAAIKLVIVLITIAAIFLIYNSGRERWHTASSISVKAARPSNTPVMDIDSLIKMIEGRRGQKLDKVTQTNLRIRNTWPDRIELKLTTDRDTNTKGSRFYNIELAIDNSTGYMIDNAVVELRDWRSGSFNASDTFQFNDIGYSSVARRLLDKEYFSDSVSVSFLSIRSKAFNFCYAWDKESNYGNLNDRWFCKE